MTSENGSRSREEIRRDIEHSREALGDTVAALAAKTDVKARAREKVDEVKTSVAERRHALEEKASGTSAESAAHVAEDGARRARENPIPLAIGGAVLAGFLVGRLSAGR